MMLCNMKPSFLCESNRNTIRGQNHIWERQSLSDPRFLKALCPDKFWVVKERKRVDDISYLILLKLK